MCEKVFHGPYGYSFDGRFHASVPDLHEKITKWVTCPPSELFLPPAIPFSQSGNKRPSEAMAIDDDIRQNNPNPRGMEGPFCLRQVFSQRAIALEGGRVGVCVPHTEHGRGQRHEAGRAMKV